jgi:hypothetical protein
MARMRGLVVFVAVCSACARPSFDTLPRPVVLRTHDVGDNCNGTIAIDADGDVWQESGCEATSSGVNRRQHLSEAERARVRATLDELRRVPDSKMGAVRCAHFLTLFTLRESDGSRREWYVCPPEDSQPWPAPFADVFAVVR